MGDSSGSFTPRSSYAAVLAITILLSFHATMGIDSESDFSTVELIVKHGYPAESHELVTEDGYILTLHRIPFSPKSPQAPKKPVVLIFHGMICSSANVVVLGPGLSEAYIHSDNGYDVWLANFRGNTYSRKHANLSTWSKEYWNFSFHEMGTHDAPAKIDYILKKTGQDKLYISALSLGTTVFFIMASVKPEYNDKIRIMAAEGPVAKLAVNHGSIATTRLSEFTVNIIYQLGVKGIINIEWLLKFVADTICTFKLTRPICSVMVYVATGYDPRELLEDYLPVIISHLSGGISTKSLVHLIQIYKSGKFQSWDYGKQQNMVAYNRTTPPAYNLSAITAPVALLYGSNDPLGQPHNAIWMNETLGNCVELYRVPRDTFTHFGFVFGKDTKRLVLDEVSRLFKLY